MFFWNSLAFSGGGNGTPLQYSCLEIPMEGGGCSSWGRWELGTTKRLHFHSSLSFIGGGNGNPLQCSCLENPRNGEPGGLPSMGSHRVGHDWSNLAAAAACFFDDPTDVCNLISGSSAFSKTSLNIWKFTVHVLLKSGFENFEHYFTSVWDE